MTDSACSLYINLQPESIENWREMEQKFYEQFCMIEPEVSMDDISCIYILLLNSRAQGIGFILVLLNISL